MVTAAETHEVFNQSPPFAGLNLFTTDPALGALVEGLPQPVVDELASIGAAVGHGRDLRPRPHRQRLSAGSEDPRRHRRADRRGRVPPGLARADAPKHRERAALLGVGRRRRGGQRARRRPRRAALHDRAGRGRPHLPDDHDQRRRRRPRARAAPCRPLAAAHPHAPLRSLAAPAQRQGRHHHRHGHDREAGRQRCRRQYDPGGRGRRSLLAADRPQVVPVGADQRCLPGAGADRRWAVLLPDAALAARRRPQRHAADAPQGQARQPLQRHRRGRVRRCRRLAGRRTGTRRGDHPRHGDAHPARLRRVLRGAHALGARRGGASRPPSQGLRPAAHRPRR